MFPRNGAARWSCSRQGFQQSELIDAYMFNMLTLVALAVFQYCWA